MTVAEELFTIPGKYWTKERAKNVYDKLIAKALSRNKKEGVVPINPKRDGFFAYGCSVFHDHHILPRCVAPSHIDDPGNIAHLSLREHWLAHVLLARMFPTSPKLVYAARMMKSSARAHFVFEQYKWAWMKGAFWELKWDDGTKQVLGLFIPKYDTFTHYIIVPIPFDRFKIMVARKYVDKNLSFDKIEQTDLIEDWKAGSVEFKNLEECKAYCEEKVRRGFDIAEDFLRTRNRDGKYGLQKYRGKCLKDTPQHSMMCDGCDYFGHLRELVNSRFPGCVYWNKTESGECYCLNSKIKGDVEEVEEVFENKKFAVSNSTSGEISMYLKPCRKCGVRKPVSEFTKDNKNKDGIRNTCKDCEKKHRTKRREEGDALYNRIKEEQGVETSDLDIFGEKLAEQPCVIEMESHNIRKELLGDWIYGFNKLREQIMAQNQQILIQNQQLMKYFEEFGSIK